MTRKKSIRNILRDGFIFVHTHDDIEPLETARALDKAGFSNMEITCRIKAPLEALEKIKQEMPDFTVGMASLIDDPACLKRFSRAGLNLPSLKEAVDAGADYCVSAGSFREESYRAFGKKLPLIPGCSTASEVIRQFGLGASFIKIFPAKFLGAADFIKALDAPLHKKISFVPMGGISIKLMEEYFKAGCFVSGGSYNLFTAEQKQEICQDKDIQLLVKLLVEIKEVIFQARKKYFPEIDFFNMGLDQIAKKSGRLFM